MTAKVRELVTDICEFHEVPLEKFLEGKRGTSYTAARSACVKRLRGMGMSLSEIGQQLGIHHTSVLYYIRRPVRVALKNRDIPCPDLSGEWAI